MAYRGGGGRAGGLGGGEHHPAYSRRGVPMGGRGGVSGPTGFVCPPPGESTPRPAAPATAVYHNPAATGPHMGADNLNVVHGTPSLSTDASSPFQPARVSVPRPSPPRPGSRSSAPIDKERTLAPPAAAAAPVAGSPAGQAAAKKAAEVDLAPHSKNVFPVADKNIFRYDLDNDVLRALADDQAGLFLTLVDSLRNAALGSTVSMILDQDISCRLLHLACRHDAVKCARLLIERGAPVDVDARDELTRTPLHIAAEAHSTKCIQLLLSNNACANLRVVDGRPLLALEVALRSKRFQVDWTLDNPVEDLLAYLQQKDLKVVKILSQKTNEVPELAFRYAMKGHIIPLAMLLLAAHNIISAIGITELCIRVMGELASAGEAITRERNCRRKALRQVILLLKQFGALPRSDSKGLLPPLLGIEKAGDCEQEDENDKSYAMPKAAKRMRYSAKECNDQAALLFKEAGEKQKCGRELPGIHPRGFGIGEEQVTSVEDDQCYSTLQQYGAPCDIFVDSPAGRITVTIELNKSVSALKQMIEKKIGCNLLRCTLYTGCKILEDQKLLYAYGLSTNSVINLNIKLLGGAPGERPSKRIRGEELEEEEIREEDKIYTLGEFRTKNLFWIDSQVPDNAGEWTRELTPAARRLAKSIERIFHQAAVEGKTLNGAQPSHFRVRNGEAYLLTPAKVPTGNEPYEFHWRKDQRGRAYLIKNFFTQTVDGVRKYSPYMKFLAMTIEGVESKWCQANNLWYEYFCKTNLAYMRAHRRLHVATDVMKLYDNLKDPLERKRFEAVVDQVLPPEGWVDYDKKSWPQFDPTIDYRTKKGWPEYPHTSFGCLTCIRNYGVHGTVLPWNKGEVAIPTVMKDFLSKVIRNLMESGFEINLTMDDD